MEQTYAIAAVWLGLAVLSAVLASHLRISIALVEICVGMGAALVADCFLYPNALGANLDWLRFIASVGAVLLTFLAGAELDPTAMRAKFKEVTIVGLFGFFAPFLGCAALARFGLGWNGPASWLAGIALSTTSMAVVYAVMLESGFNRTEFGKGILGACFVNDLGTVIALGLMFAPFTYRTAVFAAVSIVFVSLLPFLTSRLTSKYGNRTAAIRTKWILLVLCGAGGVGRLVGKRGGAARLRRGNGAGQDRRPGPFVHSTFANAHHRVPHAVLFHPRRLARFAAGIGVGPVGLPGAVFGENGLQGVRPFPRDRHVSGRRQGTVVLHAYDVHGADLWHDFGPLRTNTSDRDSRAILVPGGNGDWQRRDSHLDCQRRILPSPSLAQCADRISGDSATGISFWRARNLPARLHGRVMASRNENPSSA